VPEKSFVFSEVPPYPLLQVSLRGAHVNVSAFVEPDFANGIHVYAGVFF
jgi:hypothetical protein